MTTGCCLLILPGSNRQRKLYDCADQNTCLIFEPDTPTTISYSHSTTPNVFDLPSPVYLFVCSALSLDHLPIIIDVMCHSPFLQPQDRPDFRPIDWVNFQAHLEDEIPKNPDLHKVVSIDTCVENLSCTNLMKALAASNPNRCRVMTCGPRLELLFRM